MSPAFRIATPQLPSILWRALVLTRRCFVPNLAIVFFFAMVATSLTQYLATLRDAAWSDYVLFAAGFTLMPVGMVSSSLLAVAAKDGWTFASSLETPTQLLRRIVGIGASLGLINALICGAGTIQNMSGAGTGTIAPPMTPSTSLAVQLILCWPILCWVVTFVLSGSWFAIPLVLLGGQPVVAALWWSMRATRANRSRIFMLSCGLMITFGILVATLPGVFLLLIPYFSALLYVSYQETIHMISAETDPLQDALC